MKRLKILLLAAILFSLLLTNVSAADFGHTFNDTDIIHYNQSFTFYNDKVTPIQEWKFLAWLGVSLFIIACLLSTIPEANEIDAMFSVMAWFPLGLSALTSTSIGAVTGSGAISGTQVLSGADYNVWVLLENHTVYHFDLTAIMMWIFLAIAILNTIRIILNHRKLEQMMSV